MPGLKPTQDTLGSPEYSAIRSYLSGQVSCGNALDNFCEPVEDVFMKTQNPSDVEDRLWKMWKALIAASSSCRVDEAGKPDAHQLKLVEMVMELQTRPSLEKAGQVCEVEGMTVWKDMPLFGWEMREAWNGGQYPAAKYASEVKADGSVAASDNDDEESQKRWISINAWTAALVATAHKQAHDKPDMSLYCIWTIRTALEEGKQTSKTALSAATMWLISAAPTIWDFCRQEKTFDGKVAKPGSLCSDQEWRGFTRDRWRHWSQRLQDLQGAISDGQTAGYVEAARRAMGDVVER